VEGFSCEAMKVHARDIENRRQQVVMHRRWVQAVFTYRRGGAAQQQQGQQLQAQQHDCGAPGPDAGSASSSSAADVQQEAPAAGTAAAAGACAPGPSQHVAGAWLGGSAGRLAHQRGLMPGVPSGRALLPETLDCADQEAGSIVPSLARWAGELQAGAGWAVHALYCMWALVCGCAGEAHLWSDGICPNGSSLRCTLHC
jgi:hypothetical protein